MRTRALFLLVSFALATPFAAAANTAIPVDPAIASASPATPPAKYAAATDRKSELGHCVERGVSYYKEIGSYPTLTAAPNTGRDADTVVLERCRRSFRAF